MNYVNLNVNSIRINDVTVWVYSQDVLDPLLELAEIGGFFSQSVYLDSRLWTIIRRLHTIVQGWVLVGETPGPCFGWVNESQTSSCLSSSTTKRGLWDMMSREGSPNLLTQVYRCKKSATVETNPDVY